MITENFSDDVGCVFSRKAQWKMREIHVMSQTKILLLHVQVITIITAWSFILWQLIRQTKSNSELFSCYKYIILETCALDQQPCAEMLAKHLLNAPLKYPWGHYDVIMLLLQTLPSSYQYSFQPIIAVLRILYEGMIDKMQPDMSGFQKLE